MIDGELKARAEKYLKLEEEALLKISIAVPDDSSLFTIAEDFIRMARDYYSDAKSFMVREDYINCISAINYSYGWLDAGVRLGILSGSGDHRLFVHYR
ncbi:MAG: DUF357 domain-containing protein [Candidatus Thermoplasmatota archaeon]|nr:DUF357 domain-containing protein [Candidatus Thermoplasmatota archaeon]